eukprot:2322100-Prymnesium_polylepis.1
MRVSVARLQLLRRGWAGVTSSRGETRQCVACSPEFRNTYLIWNALRAKLFRHFADKHMRAAVILLLIAAAPHMKPVYVQPGFGVRRVCAPTPNQSTLHVATGQFPRGERAGHDLGNEFAEVDPWGGGGRRGGSGGEWAVRREGGVGTRD